MNSTLYILPTIVYMKDLLEMKEMYTTLKMVVYSANVRMEKVYVKKKLLVYRRPRYIPRIDRKRVKSQNLIVILYCGHPTA